MKTLESFKNSKSGTCLCVGHGEGIKTFDWKKVLHLPKILVNFYEPKFQNILGVVIWDSDIFNDIYIRRGKSTTPILFYSGEYREKEPDVFIDPYTFPPVVEDKGKVNIFSGARAIYLAQYIGFYKIYLVGYDFIPHVSTDYTVQKKEVEGLQNRQSDLVIKGLQTHMNCFKKVDWIHKNVFQTNKDSEFKYFKYGEIL